MRRSLGALLSLLVAGCAGVNFLPGEEPISLVVRGGAPFWTYGPQQAGGPNERLTLGDQIAVLRWEYGFSRVQLESGATGYVANEDIEPAPPGTPRRIAVSNVAAPRPRGRPVDPIPAAVENPDQPSRPRYEGPIVDDAPLPMPDPDLDTAPPDAPGELF